jgi:hypothetical protein
LHRWAPLLKQQSSITIYCLSTKENKHLFAAKKWKFAVYVFRLQQTNGSCRFLLVPFSVCPYIRKQNYIYLYAAASNGRLKVEAQAIFLKLLTTDSSCKKKFAICPFVEEETNRSYLFANELNGLNRLPYIWKAANSKHKFQIRQTCQYIHTQTTDENTLFRWPTGIFSPLPPKNSKMKYS